MRLSLSRVEVPPPVLAGLKLTAMQAQVVAPPTNTPAMGPAVAWTWYSLAVPSPASVNNRVYPEPAVRSPSEFKPKTNISSPLTVGVGDRLPVEGFVLFPAADAVPSCPAVLSSPVYSVMTIVRPVGVPENAAVTVGAVLPPIFFADQHSSHRPICTVSSNCSSRT